MLGIWKLSKEERAKVRELRRRINALPNRSYNELPDWLKLGAIWFGWVVMVILFVALLTSFVFAGGTYQDGWREGYPRGYCAGINQPNCLAPVTPIPPVAPAGQATYGDGYDEGFSRGHFDGRRSGR